MRNVLNRLLIVVIGLVLLGGGGWLGVNALVARDEVSWQLPSWWRGPRAYDHLVDRAALDRMRDQGWWAPVVISGLAVLFLLFLFWLLAQGRSRGPASLLLRRSGGRLRRGALESAVTAEAETLPGVAGARARLTMKKRGQRRFRARMTVVLEPYAEPGPVLDGLVHGPLKDAGSSTGFGIPATTVRMRATGHRGRRVR
ncbi:alkaline shock response membrane anchor protein AmaP [Streptomyces montanisoli]|uniref:Alkaline shock response membrane anchor protein AmaP n=1 Tax=Streptomyces montanisoli TaxID=2798581 RepID=A0A940MAN1_9ACTN|nr:alkaline shock response membrane anchor protein AmaP [Streptomyces montanisoli]MBP0457438.1 alkaline shock response membrane anchor protein AmaP [Streptomyces montanisoli]